MEDSWSRSLPTLPLPSLRSPSIKGRDSVYSIFIQQLSNKGNRMSFSLNMPRKTTQKHKAKVHWLAPSHRAYLPASSSGFSHSTQLALPDLSLGLVTTSLSPLSSLPQIIIQRSRPRIPGDLLHAICHFSVPGDPGHRVSPGISPPCLHITGVHLLLFSPGVSEVNGGLFGPGFLQAYGLNTR